MAQNHTLLMSVRDYECDLQGVVNNAVYQNYLEHARHEYLKSNSINFAELTQQGINLVVVRAELDYKFSLSSGDEFEVHTKTRRISRLKFGFVQQIIRLPDNKSAIEALVTGVALNQSGKPFIPEFLSDLMVESE